MVISSSLQTCGVVLPFAIPTSICRSNVTICSALYLLLGISSRPPGEFSLTSAGTKNPGQVKAQPEITLDCVKGRRSHAALVATLTEDLVLESAFRNLLERETAEFSL